MIRSCRLSVLVLAALAAAVAGVRSQSPASTSAPDEALKAVRARVAPDRRLTVFDVRIEQTGDGLAVRGEVESAAARDAAVAAVRSAAAGVPVADRIVVLPDASFGLETSGIVRVSVANVRATPAQGAELVTQTLMGWTVRVLKRQGGWILVHTEPDGYLGWIEDLQVARVGTAGRDGWNAPSRLVVTAPFTLARESPSATATPVSDLVIGNVVKATGPAAEWRQIELPDSRRAFVRSSDVQEHAAWKGAQRATPERIARTAAEFMGVPYLWGGTSVKGFDCSGFAKTVFHLNGIELPRDTDQQAAMGLAVPIDEGFTHLRAGDLLFFGTAATPDRAERVSHVGIHVGNREFIHASGLVRRNSLDPASPIYDDGRRKSLLRIRRLLPET